MNLHEMLRARAEAERPLRVGLIGAGKFGAMFLSQARLTPGIHLLAVADLDPDRARDALAETGWPAESYTAQSAAKALAGGGTWITDDGKALINAAGVDVVIEATGDPAAGIAHALACFERGRHVVMVNVEADVLAGPLLAERAKAAGVVYSLAYGDQPALICELVDWARATGFEVVCAGKGTLYMPELHGSTPDTVWDHYGLSAEHAAVVRRDQGRSQVAGAAGREAEPVGGRLQAGGVGHRRHLDARLGTVEERVEHLGVHAALGGVLDGKSRVEVVSSRHRDGNDISDDLRWGVYVTFEAPTDYVRRCFADYGLMTDVSGRYSALWRPYHLIGLELGVSVAYAGLLQQPTGGARSWRADVVATAKRDLAAGEELDGEGGFTVWGKLMPARDSAAMGAVPIGLAHGVKLKSDVAAGAVVRWQDVAAPADSPAHALRREMERAYAPTPQAKSA